MSTPSALEQVERQCTELINQRERLLYWLCKTVYEWPATATSGDSVAMMIWVVLREFGYDHERVKQMVQLGEPSGGRPAPLIDAASRYASPGGPHHVLVQGVPAGKKLIVDGVEPPQRQMCASHDRDELRRLHQLAVKILITVDEMIDEIPNP